MKELKFTDNIIINSSEIQNWLEQFNKDKLDKEIAIKILKQLRFFTISDFNIFIKQSLTDLVRKISKDRTKLAIYPIIKLTNESEKIWRLIIKVIFLLLVDHLKVKEVKIWLLMPFMTFANQMKVHF